jgi:hypothetical protein
VRSNRQYSSALASHAVPVPCFAGPRTRMIRRTHTCGCTTIEHLNDIEELSKTESQLDERIRAEGWNAGSDLHYAVDHDGQVGL